MLFKIIAQTLNVAPGEACEEWEAALITLPPSPLRSQQQQQQQSAQGAWREGQVEQPQALPCSRVIICYYPDY